MRRTRLACGLVALLGLVLMLVQPAAAPPAAAGAVAAPPAQAPAAPKALPPIPAIPGHFAIGHGQHVEMPGLRTRFSHTVANGDGTYTATYTTGAQNYQDANGQWQPIDNTLVPDTRSGYAWAPRANSFAAHLPASLAAAPVVVDQGTTELRFALQGASAAAGGASGATATYPNALPGVAVAYALAGAALAETLTLASAAAPHSFVFSLATTGLTARANGTGGVDFLDGTGAVALAFAPPAMRDARGAESRASTLTLGTGTVTLAADPAWLADPARAYPVALDPTVSGADSQDCDIHAAAPTTSFCQSDDLDVADDGEDPMRSLVQFPVTPAAVTVLDATVSLYLFGATTSNTTDVSLQQVTTPWTTGATWQASDGAHTWQNAGGDFVASPSATATNVGGSAGTWVSWHPTALVAGWVDGTIPNDGLLLKEASETVVQDLGFCSGGTRGADNGCTAATQPTLAITYVPLTGFQPYYAMRTFPLDDRMALAVNLANGNLVVAATDLAIAGTGLGYDFDRSYNEQLSVPPTFLGGATGGGVGLGFDADGSAYLFLPGGAVAPFPLDAQGGFVAPPGLDATLVPVQGGYLLTFQASGLRYAFASGGQLVYILDPNGNTITLDYTGGTLTGVTDTQNRTVSYQYTNGNLTRVTDWTGRYVTYGYNAGNQLTTYTDADGQPTQFGYDPATGNLTSITDPLNQRTAIAYYADLAVQAVTLGAGSPVAAAYQFAYRPGAGPGSTVTTVTDPNTHQTVYTTDGRGRPTQATDALNNSQQWTWTADNHVHVYTDAKQQQTVYGYDASNNPNQVTLPTGASASAVYGAVANLPGFFVPTSVTDTQGNTVSYTPDANGNVHVVSTPAMVNSQTTVTTISETIDHNPDGTVEDVYDFNNNETRYFYTNGNLTSITPPTYTPGPGSQPLGPTTITPDALSRPHVVTDGKGQTATSTYDGLDRVTNVQYLDGSIAYQPDADGNVRSMTDGNGQTSYGYDARNRQTSKTLPASLGGGSFAYGYDPASNLTSYQDAGGTVVYHYNPADEPDYLLEPSQARTNFFYDPNHRRTTTSYPDGVTMTFGYDNSGRVSTVTATNASATLVGLTYAYTNPATNKDTGLVYTITEDDSPGVGPFPTRQFTTTQAYDPRNLQLSWLVKQTGNGAVVHDYEYQFDANGNRTKITADATVSPPPAVPTTALAYNAVNELLVTSLENSSGGKVATATWYYDAAGNQTGNSGYAGISNPLTITYNQHDQTASITDAYQHPVAMAWTGAGQAERTSADWSNQPTGATPEYGHTTYANAALGVMSQANGNGTTYYTRDPSGLPISERKGTSSYYYLLDGEGNVVMLVDPPNGSPVALYDPCPTGNQAGDGWVLPGFADDNLWQRYGAFGVGYDAGIKDLFGFGVFTDGNSNNPTQRNCDNPLDPLMCVGPTPGPCFFGAGCSILPGILKNFCLFFCKDSGGGAAEEPWAAPPLSTVTTEETVYYRVWGGTSGQVGRWVTPVSPSSSMAARSGLALPPENTAQYVSTVTIPAGTPIEQGIAGPGFGQPGGWAQVYVPGNLDVGLVRSGHPLGAVRGT